VLDNSYNLKVERINHNNFHEWTKHFNEHYRKLSSNIAKNHIFQVKEDDIKTNNRGTKSVIIRIREADLADAEEEMFEVKKRGPSNSSAPNSTQPAVVDKPEPNAMKTVQFYEKWSKVIPKKYHGEMCKKTNRGSIGQVSNREEDQRELQETTEGKEEEDG
jgi:hypothetical protein